MQVVICTSDEPLYVPIYLEPILSAHADSIERILIVPFTESLSHQVRTQAGMYGARAGIQMGFRYLRGQILDILPGNLGWRLTGRPHSVTAVAQANGIPIATVSDVNAAEVIEAVRTIDPDLLLSIVAGQRLSSELRSTVSDAINLHGSLLPKYRGRATAFWPLYYDDDRTGVTANRMTDQFDAGPIIAQRSFPIESTDTVDSIYRKLASVGAELAIELLDEYPDLPSERPNKSGPDDYHGVPGPTERRQFYERGNAFL